MIEPVLTAHHTDLIRVVRKPQRQANGNDHRGIPIYANSNNAGPAGSETFLVNITNKTIPLASLRQDLVEAYIPSSRVTTSVGQFMEELQTVASIVNTACPPVSCKRTTKTTLTLEEM